MINYSHVRAQDWNLQVMRSIDPYLTLDTRVRVATLASIEAFLRSNSQATHQHHRHTTRGTCPDGADIAVLMMASPGFMNKAQLEMLLSQVAGDIELVLNTEAPVHPRVFIGVQTWGFIRDITVQVPAPELLTP